MYKVEWTEKEKALLESKLQESVAAKSELDHRLEKIETASTNQRNHIFGMFLYR